MAAVKITDLEPHLPIDIFDANGMVIRRGVVEFDPETGRVVSFVYDRDGQLRINYDLGEVERREEFYPPPLVWRSISPREAEEARKRCLDFEGK